MYIYRPATNTYEEVPDPPPALPPIRGLSPFRPRCLTPMPTLHEIEREALIRALDQGHGVICSAAALLGLTIRVMHYKINKHGLRAFTQAATHASARRELREQLRLRKVG